MTDALSEIYYINSTDEAEKALIKYVGKNIKVVITGNVETKEGDTSYFFELKSVEPYAPKLPPVQPPSPAISTPSDEAKTGANTSSSKSETSTDAK